MLKLLLFWHKRLDHLNMNSHHLNTINFYLDKQNLKFFTMTSLPTAPFVRARPPHQGLPAGQEPPAMSCAHQVSKRPATMCSLDSHELLRGQKTIEILHNGSTYRLQATRLGKLILTK